MRWVDHVRVRLERARVHGDEVLAVEDSHLRRRDERLDVIPDEAVGDAVADRVDVDERVVGHPPLQPATVGRQRPRRERPQRRSLLVLEPNCRLLVSRTVDALVGAELPLGEVRLEMGAMFSTGVRFQRPSK